MKKALLSVVVLILILISGFIGLTIGKKTSKKTDTQEIRFKPLEKYTIENLSQTDIKPGKLEIKDVMEEGENYVSYLFQLTFNPNLDGKTFKKITGQINLPGPSTIRKGSEMKKSKEKFPIIVMFRGYIDQTKYKTGDGTRNAADFFAKNALITIAPDFLGFAGSDKEVGNIFEARFQTYTTSLSLIKSLDQIVEWNNKDIFLWGHSNGGQIALTILEILGERLPTTLWAPVSKPFPYSVLFFTDASDDRGKLIRYELSEFEKKYEVELYSLTNYLEKINSPLQIHQGESDDAVPKKWSDELSEKLKTLNKNFKYYLYPDTDHNMFPVWNDVVSRDLEFFKLNGKFPNL